MKREIQWFVEPTGGLHANAMIAKLLNRQAAEREQRSIPVFTNSGLRRACLWVVPWEAVRQLLWSQTADWELRFLVFQRAGGSPIREATGAARRLAKIEHHPANSAASRQFSD